MTQNYSQNPIDYEEIQNSVINNCNQEYEKTISLLQNENQTLKEELNKMKVSNEQLKMLLKIKQ